jgi:hypothetical protein
VGKQSVTVITRSDRAGKDRIPFISKSGKVCGVNTQPLPSHNIIAHAFGSMTCVDFDGFFMLKKVICFYNRKPLSSGC